MSGQVHPFSELMAATGDAAAHSDWEQGWIVAHAEGAELLSQHDNRFMDRTPSQRERLQMSMFPSEIAHWTVPHTEGAEIGGSVSELGSQREGAEFEDLFLASPWRSC